MNNMRIDRVIISAGLVSIAWTVGHGCKFQRVNASHCNNNEGDAYCAEQYPDGSLPFCESGFSGCISPQRTFGCTAERPPDECYSPCGGSSTLEEDASCLAGETASSSSGESSDSGSESSDGGSSGSSETTATTGLTPCMGHEECLDPAAPICDAALGECVPCDPAAGGDAACAEADTGTPACLDGVCVECTAGVLDACQGVTPVCDEETNECAPCTEHDECGDAACNLFTGACLPADAVVRVGVGQDFSSIGAAIDSFAAGEEGTIIIEQGDYNEAETVDGGRVLAFLANDGEIPAWDTPGASMAPQLTVVDGTVVLEGLELSGNGSSTSPGLLVDGGRAWLDRARVADNNGGGIVAQNSAELVLRNCFVGDGTNGANGADIDGASATIVYSTLGAGFDNFGDVYAISCNDPVAVSVRNSILVSLDNATGEMSCPDAVVSNTASETLLPGKNNVALGDVGLNWFDDIDTGDFHLNSPPIDVATAAVWEAGDPGVDIDGDLRDAVDGVTGVAGADVP